MNQPTLFLHILRMGQKEGYPPCCVRQFASEAIAGKKPAVLRKVLPSGCVPCHDCWEYELVGIRRPKPEQFAGHLARKYVSLAYGHVFIDNCHAHVPAEYDGRLDMRDDYPFMERVERYLGFGDGGAGSFRGNVLKADIGDVERIMECMLTNRPPPKFSWIFKIFDGH